MRINRTDKNNLTFTSWMNNRVVLKGLEKISDHGTSFAAATSLVMSLGVRPLAIFATPGVERENKEYASVNSISSGLVKFGLVEAVALPVENAVKRIDGVIRFNIEFDAMIELISSSLRNSEYGSYPLGIISPMVFFNAVKFNLLHLLYVSIKIRLYLHKESFYKNLYTSCFAFATLLVYSLNT